MRPHVNLLVDVDTGDDEEDAGAPRSPRQQPAQAEDDGPLVLLHHLHHEHQRERHGGEDEEEGAEGEDVGHDAGSLLALDGELSHLVSLGAGGVGVPIGDHLVTVLLVRRHGQTVLDTAVVTTHVVFAIILYA